MFSPAHRAALPEQELRAYFELSERRHGACRFEQVLEVREPGEMVLRYGCDKGQVEVEVEGSVVGAIQITKLKLVSRGIEGSEASEEKKGAAAPSNCR